MRLTTVTTTPWQPPSGRVDKSSLPAAVGAAYPCSPDGSGPGEDNADHEISTGIIASLMDAGFPHERAETLWSSSPCTQS